MESAGGVTASCHCGAVRLTLPGAPTAVARCNCSLCRTTGWRGAYYSPREVMISGSLDEYVRTDMENPLIRIMRCARCGIATHWEYIVQPPPEDRIGINANILDPALIEGLPVHEINGADWL